MTRKPDVPEDAITKVEEMEAAFHALQAELPDGAEPAAILSESAVLGE